MLQWIFGGIQENIVHLYQNHKAAGYLQLKKARVRWFLSIDYHSLPKEIKEKGQRTYRSITVEGKEIEFSSGFTDLHTLSYRKILDNSGFGLSDSLPCISAVYDIRNTQPIGLKNNFHPLAKE
jgi:UDP-N-acetyl-2-amino-2-deoxyglucuronate dehydrogenase